MKWKVNMNIQTKMRFFFFVNVWNSSRPAHDILDTSLDHAVTERTTSISTISSTHPSIMQWLKEQPLSLRSPRHIPRSCSDWKNNLYLYNLLDTSHDHAVSENNLYLYEKTSFLSWQHSKTLRSVHLKLGVGYRNM